jgi:hypothetical protein
VCEPPFRSDADGLEEEESSSGNHGGKANASQRHGSDSRGTAITVAIIVVVAVTVIVVVVAVIVAVVVALIVPRNIRRSATTSKGRRELARCSRCRSAHGDALSGGRGRRRIRCRRRKAAGGDDPVDFWYLRVSLTVNAS